MLGNLAKLTDVKLQLLEAKVDKLQANVSVMHSRSMQGTPPIGIFYPSVVPDRSNPPASSAPTSDTESNFYAMWKGWWLQKDHNSSDIREEKYYCTLSFCEPYCNISEWSCQMLHPVPHADFISNLNKPLLLAQDCHMGLLSSLWWRILAMINNKNKRKRKLHMWFPLQLYWTVLVQK